MKKLWNIICDFVVSIVAADGLAQLGARTSADTIMTKNLGPIYIGEQWWFEGLAGIILGMGSANERRRYVVPPPLIGWAHTQNDPWLAMH